jgi:hypothetical protein
MGKYFVPTNKGAKIIGSTAIGNNWREDFTVLKAP